MRKAFDTIGCLFPWRYVAGFAETKADIVSATRSRIQQPEDVGAVVGHSPPATRGKEATNINCSTSSQKFFPVKFRFLQKCLKTLITIRTKSVPPHFQGRVAKHPAQFSLRCCSPERQTGKHYGKSRYLELVMKQTNKEKKSS